MSTPPLRLAAPLNTEPEPRLVWIEVATSLQLPSFHIVGLPSPEVAEARERVRSAIVASGFEFPRRRVVLNLSPASLRKQGTGMDLAMALAVLGSSNPPLTLPSPSPWAAWGELGLDGAIKAAGQTLRLLAASWSAGVTDVILSAEEATLARDRLSLLSEAGNFAGPPPRIHGASSLADAWSILRGRAPGPGAPLKPGTGTQARVIPLPHAGLLPLSPSLSRTLGIAAAGRHHLLLLGPRGSGKSHALEWLIALQPPSSAAVRATQGLLQEIGRPHLSAELGEPVRRIGMSVRASALYGSAGPGWARPGEFSLAHGGLLIADELPEWARDARESLREPLERGQVTLNRARTRIEMPARFVLAGTGNFCPCGGWPREILRSRALLARAGLQACRCATPDRQRYLARLSGPILDRIDILVPVSASPKEPSNPGPSFAELRRRVLEARDRLRARWGCPPGELQGPDLERLLTENPRWLRQPALHGSPSLRGRHKTLRLALSLSAWDGADTPQEEHFTEASHLRPEQWHET